MTQIITDGYNKIAVLECSVCRDSHQLSLTVENSDLSLELLMHSQKFSIKQLILHYAQMKLFPSKFISGEKRYFFGISLTISQIKQLVSILSLIGYTPTKYDVLPKLVDKDTIELFSSNGVLVSKDYDLQTIEISIHPTEKIYTDNYVNGECWSYLPKSEVDKLLYILWNIELNNNNGLYNNKEIK